MNAKHVKELAYAALDKSKKEYDSSNVEEEATEKIFSRAANIFLTDMMREAAMPEDKRIATINKKLSSLDGEAKKLLEHLILSWHNGSVDENGKDAPAIMSYRSKGKTHQIDVKQLRNSEGKPIIPFNDLYSRVNEVVPNVVWILEKLRKKGLLKPHYVFGDTRFMQRLRRVENGKTLAEIRGGVFDERDLVSNLEESYIEVVDWDDLCHALDELHSGNKEREDKIIDLNERSGHSFVDVNAKVASLSQVILLSELKEDDNIIMLLEYARKIAEVKN